MSSTQAALNTPSCLSVSELTKALNELVEGHFFDVCFSGEISQCTLASSGHLYMTVKDDQSQIRAVMWRGNASRLSFKPEEGLAVVCTARANVYSKSGQLQMVVSHMELAGKGDLHQQFLKLKAKLEKEGLFDQERKREIPFFPKAIGVVTSKSGAVIHDIMVKVTERMPHTQVYLIDVRVQGDGASEEISAAIDQFNNLENVDVLIVGRGGGSLEDLWPFNEEVVVRAIFRSKIPVISAVGHEVDITLADLVSDLRSPTPTAAAEAAVPSRKQLLAELEKLERRLVDKDRWLTPLGQIVDEQAIALSKSVKRLLELKSSVLKQTEYRVQSIKPGHLLKLLRERVGTNSLALSKAIGSFVGSLEQRISGLEARFKSANPAGEVESHKSSLLQFGKRLESSKSLIVKKEQERLKSLGLRLEALSYKSTLARGYAIVRHNEAIIKDSKGAEPDDFIDITLHQGKLTAKVTESKR